MNNQSINSFIDRVLENAPSEWAKLTTHRLDIYNESKAKTEFLEELEKLIDTNDPNELDEKLKLLPTAFDYIRLGHPLSCFLEWTIAKKCNLSSDDVISFSSTNMPLFAILRKNKLETIDSQIIHQNLPASFDEKTLRDVYGYSFHLTKDEEINSEKTNILVTNFDHLFSEFNKDIDFVIAVDDNLGSLTLCLTQKAKAYISEIQHVRRRESIAMTPQDCLSTFNFLKNKSSRRKTIDLNPLKKTINDITQTNGEVVLGSSGLSIQYAITMGLIEYAGKNLPGKKIKIIVPPNCYGGTNDQARRAAATLEHVEILDLPVDSGRDMVTSVDQILDHVAREQAVPFIIAEIPTNPRVEVPNLEKLAQALEKKRDKAIDPVFILDQTFCPNFHFLGPNDSLANVQTISYVSGSKFPSGGLCTAGYCVANKKAEQLISFVDKHLKLCHNEATNFQLEVLSEQMPSMNQRIADAYKNTRAFVNHIEKELPGAKINFVSEELAQMGFTPSVFSLDLPTKGYSEQERELYKRELNLKLINMMIKEIPEQSKFCVSYGQLKGCYWTIPATSTQGTTKEGDKDYIVRVSVSPEFDLERHKKVFTSFCESIK